MPERAGADPLLTDLDEHLPGIAAGDQRAFGRWLAGAERPVRESLRRFARCVDTEAVLQEALLRVWQAAARFAPDGRPNALLRFAMVAARNLAISETRRRGREAPAPVGDDLRPDPAPPPDPILKAAIARCFSALSSRPKQVLALRLLDAGRRPDRELAEQSGMKLNTFLQNVTRARSSLAECLARAGVAWN